MGGPLLVVKHVMCKNRVSVIVGKRVVPMGCESFDANFNIPSPRPITWTHVIG